MRTELDCLCDKCKYSINGTWCKSKKCNECHMSDKDTVLCICLTVDPRKNECPYFIPKE